MPRSVGVAVGICSVFIAALHSVACSSSHPGSYSAAAGAAASANGNSSGGSDGLNVTGGNGNGTANSGNIGDKCAEEVSTAMPIPLDMYIMLDVSSSMLAATAATTTKWDAVKAAIESFLNDNASAGLGVGLQYFPIAKPNAPNSCTTDTQCGAFGPCIPLNICYNSPGNSVIRCNTDADCPRRTSPNDILCVPLSQCSKDTDYICPTAGAACSNTTLNLGTCTQTPSECANADSCDVTVYGTPARAIAALPAAAASLVASIDAQMPSGNTPTAPALSGAIQQATAWAKAHPDHRVVTLLATDGVPTECASTTVDAVTEVANIAKNGVSGTPSISTFAIGVFGPSDVAQGAPANLNKISQQGGTGNAFIIDTQKDVTAQFLSALDAIRGARLACEFQIPQPASNELLNYGLVNVQLSNGTSKDVLYYVGSAAACEATTGGWYYDVDPAQGVPTKIISCPASCASFKAAPSGASVGIAVGCQTVIK